MNLFIEWFNKYLVLVVVKIGVVWWLIVLCDVFIVIMLVMMVGLIVMVLNVLV